MSSKGKKTITEKVVKETKIKNKGTGAGGANTTKLGKKFEEETCMKKRLINNGFVEKKLDKTKSGRYLKKKEDGNTIVYLTQSGFKKYCKKKYNIEIWRNPDEAYIITTPDKCIVKILEKKEQQCEGSVETKILAGHGFRREYEIAMGDKFTIEYAFSINKFLSDKFNSKTPKYRAWRKILKEDNINVFHSCEQEYFENIEKWINKF